jgi:cysteinylglycine-S-conjugate dipeptidase
MDTTLLDDTSFAAAATRAIDELERLVAIPSVSLPGHDAGTLDECAKAVARLFDEVGATVELLQVEDGPPIVYGLIDRGAPTTVLLYAHYDVQPPGDEDAWATPPFVPSRRGQRLFGRGAADNKGGLAVHLATLDYLGADLPVNVKVLIEGEEEVGSPHLHALVAREPQLAEADIVVVPDCENWRTGVPALTVSLRGMVSCLLTVATLREPVHSGAFGGAAPEALSALARLLASLHDASGDVAIAGLAGFDDTTGPEIDEAHFRRTAGLLDGVALIGTGRLADRVWRRPAVTVLGIDAPAAGGAPAQLVPQARAKIAVRLAPGDDPSRAMHTVEAHLREYAPWGVEIEFEPLEYVAPFRAARGRSRELALRALADAWGRDAVEIGVGGSIALLATLAAAAGEAEFVLTGVGDPESNIHGPNESVHLGELRRAIEAEIRLLSYLGDASGRE